jgi:hypothetical protein
MASRDTEDIGSGHIDKGSIRHAILVIAVMQLTKVLSSRRRAMEACTANEESFQGEGIGIAETVTADTGKILVSCQTRLKGRRQQSARPLAGASKSVAVLCRASVRATDSHFVSISPLVEPRSASV